MPPTSVQRDYIVWQNRATSFYLAARTLYTQGLFAPAAFCANQALETLLKATLIHHDRSFEPEVARHRWVPMLRALRNKAPTASGISIPAYLHSGRRFQSLSRYPGKVGGFVVPASFLHDLDAAFYELLRLVPFQFNSVLVHVLESRPSPRRRALTRSNLTIRRLRTFMRPWLRRRSSARVHQSSGAA